MTSRNGLRRLPPTYSCDFTSTLRRVPGESGWIFASVPVEHAPTVTLSWGRTPVRATVDGRTWDTSVWRTKEGVTELAVPARIRGDKDHGDEVLVRLEYGVEYRT